jgi:hypothetical protein
MPEAMGSIWGIAKNTPIKTRKKKSNNNLHLEKEGLKSP